jgi:transmembrane sensor
MKAGSDINTQAASWHVRVEGGLAGAEQAEFETWLATDARHREAYALLQEDSALLDRLSVHRPRDGRVEADVRLPIRRRRTPLLRYYATTLAAAAALAVGYLGWWRPAYGTVEEIFRTSRGAVERVQLADRSVITINTDSEVAVVYTRGLRQIALTRGEAHFEVARNPNRPFIVSAEGVAVRAVGTAFNVRLRDGSVEVVVTEGKVRVDDAVVGGTLLPATSSADVPVLEAGKRFTIGMAKQPQGASDNSVAAPTNAAVSALNAGEIAQRLSWRELRIEFNPTPLANVVAEFNRYSEVQLKLADEPTGEILVGGAFNARDPDTFVELLESSFSIKATRFQNSIVLQHVP